MQVEEIIKIRVIKCEDDIGHELPKMSHGPRVPCFSGTRRPLPNVRSYSSMVFFIDRRLGRPPAFPDVPLTNRVAIPASSSLSYCRAVAFDSESRSIRDSSNEAVMEAPKVDFSGAS